MSLLPSLMPGGTVPAASLKPSGSRSPPPPAAAPAALRVGPAPRAQQLPLAAGCRQSPPRAGPTALGLSRATSGLPLRALRDSRGSYAGWCSYQRARPLRAWHRTVEPWVAQRGCAWHSLARHGSAQLGRVWLSPAYLTRPGRA